jgi:hypothetical protein
MAALAITPCEFGMRIIAVPSGLSEASTLRFIEVGVGMASWPVEQLAVPSMRLVATIALNERDMFTIP